MSQETKKFFAKMRELGIALTYNDVRLKTGYAEVRPSKVDLRSKFSKNVPLKTPIVSAAMDTITTFPMAIEIAKHGGLGVIHKNMSPELQAAHVSRVKHHLNGKTGMIEKPITIEKNMTLQEVMDLRIEKGYPFHSFLVVEKGKLLGLITRNHFLYYGDALERTVEEVMKKDVITAPPTITKEEAFKVLQKNMIKVLPLVDKKQMVQGLFVFRDIQALRSGISELYNLDKDGHLRVAAAIGVGQDSMERVKLLVEEKIDAVVVDTAHGDTLQVIEMVKQLKKSYPKLDVVAGNVTEPGSVERLIKAGADGIKVGQGPGSICTTRVIAGIGCPQVTAVHQCAEVAMQHDVPVCADGGLTFSGDIPIAIGAGASAVMVGSLLAGTDETPGETFFADGKQWKTYRGMGSLAAMKANPGSRERYQQSSKGPIVPEGIEGRVEYKGKMCNIFDQLVGGLRRGMAYAGAASIKEMHEKAAFHRITHAGHAESHPHDVIITKEAPNYQVKR